MRNIDANFFYSSRLAIPVDLRYASKLPGNGGRRRASDNFPRFISARIIELRTILSSLTYSPEKLLLSRPFFSNKGENRISSREITHFICVHFLSISGHSVHFSVVKYIKIYIYNTITQHLCDTWKFCRIKGRFGCICYISRAQNETCNLTSSAYYIRVWNFYQRTYLLALFAHIGKYNESLLICSVKNLNVSARLQCIFYNQCIKGCVNVGLDSYIVSYYLHISCREHLLQRTLP